MNNVDREVANMLEQAYEDRDWELVKEAMERLFIADLEADTSASLNDFDEFDGTTYFRLEEI